MKNIKFLFIAVLALVFTACDDDSEFGSGVDQTLIGFSNQTADFSIQIDEMQDFEVQINSTTLSDTERTINFTVSDQSTLDPSFYSISSMSITIPANEYFGSTTVTIQDAEGDVADPRTLILEITPDDSYVTGASATTTISAGINCPFVYTDIPEGLYEVTQSDFGEFFGDTMTTRTVELGPGDNQVTILEGEYPIEGSDPLIITLDDTGRVIAVNEDGLAFGNGPVSADNNFPPNFYLLGSEEGTVLSCIGRFELVLNFTPFNGNVHSFNLRFIE